MRRCLLLLDWKREYEIDAGAARAHPLHVGGQDVGGVGADDDRGAAVASVEFADGVGAGGGAGRRHCGRHVANGRNAL